jgi:hypothetical protein
MFFNRYFRLCWCYPYKLKITALSGLAAVVCFHQQPKSLHKSAAKLTAMYSWFSALTDAEASVVGDNTKRRPPICRNYMARRAGDFALVRVSTNQ